MEPIGKKLIGRFIKKQDPILDHVDVLEYSLTEIAITPTSIPDNWNNTIIHTRLHPPEQLEASIKETPIRNEVFENDVSRRPIIAPKDFTKDWERLKQRSSRRMIKLDDDEELELEMEYLREKERLENSEIPEDRENSKDHQQSQPESEAEDTVDRTDDENRALNDMAKNLPSAEDTPEYPLTIKNPNTHEIDQNDEEAQLDHAEIPQAETEDLQTPESVQDSGEAQSVLSPQGETPPTDLISEDEKERLVSEAFERGRADALNSVREEFESAANAFNKLFGEVEGMKESLLLNAHDNFRKITETMMESILGQQFNLNPDAFSNILQRAVAEAVKGDSYKIHLNPQLYDKLKDNLAEDIANKLISDDEIPIGDFKIDSQMGVVDGSLKTIVSDLLDKADIKLSIDDEEVS